MKGEKVLEVDEDFERFRSNLQKRAIVVSMVGTCCDAKVNHCLQLFLERIKVFCYKIVHTSLLGGNIHFILGLLVCFKRIVDFS